MTAHAAHDIRALEAEHILQIYKRLPVVFVRGEGMYLVDETGRRYLDFLSGLGVASLGHAHPALARAVAEQASTRIHTSNLYFHPLQGELAARLTRLTGLDRVFLCNSGTEANEACLKFARRYWHSRNETGRTKFVAFRHAFHGRTMGSLSVTWDPHYREPFAPLVPDVKFASAAEPWLLDTIVDEDTAAIIIEPVQGEGGVRPISKELVAAIHAARERTGALVIADEVQSGSGRTGVFLGGQLVGLSPDLVALGKALGAGVPVGAAVLRQQVADALSPGDHGTTYGGNLLACCAALTFLDQLEGGLQQSIRRVASHLAARLRDLSLAHPDAVKEVRGAGLIAALDLAFDAQPVVTAAFERGLLVNRTATSVVRLLPPFIVAEADVDEAVSILDAALGAAHAQGASR